MLRLARSAHLALVRHAVAGLPHEACGLLGGRWGSDHAEVFVPTRNAGMAHWREALFAVMSRNAGSVADFFRLPHNCVIELGTRVQI